MPAIARIGDENVEHCSPHSMEGGSSKWFCNGIGICRDGDATTGHLTPPDVPPCPAHSSNVSPSNRNWYVDGKLIAAWGDPHCTTIAQGSPNWFVGN